MVDVTSIQQTDPKGAAQLKGPDQTLGQDQFLNLLIAQLKHQDPLNPVDNAQFIAQLAQFSQLEQTKQMSTALNAFISQQGIANNNGMVGLIGRQISAAGASTQLGGTGSAPLSYKLAGDAATVTVGITNTAGLPVRTLQLTNQSAGSQTVTWDGRDSAGNALPPGRYSFTVNAADGKGTPVSATTFLTGMVSGLTFENGSPLVVLSTGDSVSPSQILQVR